jgi:pimeloyl-ACP methyl ester carboxylesterase
LGIPLLAVPAAAKVLPYPPSFHAQVIETNGTKLYVRIGGSGPAVVLPHGFGDTGDMWAPIALKLVANHTVIVPDLRGMGLSAHPDTGYTKQNEAVDVAGVLDHLKIEHADFVTHDIGNMVGYAFAAQYPARVTRWVVIDAPLPGLSHWAAQLSNPKSWHFNFHGPDEERLVAGRDRVIWFSAERRRRWPPAGARRSARSLRPV